MKTGGFVDWRGNPVDRKAHGGVRAASFMYFLVVVTNIANVPNLLNLVSYLRGTMHLGVSSSSTTVTNFIGATSGFALLGAFLSDSYITRSRTILIFGPLELLGYGLLALQAHLPSLRPPPCDIDGGGAAAGRCTEVHARNAGLLQTALYASAFGEGCIRACSPALGADQFDGDDRSESRQRSSFFNWFTFGISVGGFVGLILVVWIENRHWWDVAFVLCALLILLGLLAVAAGLPFYRNQVPEGSPLTRIRQVIVVAVRNRKLKLPENSDGLVPMEVPSRADSLKFLDRASISRREDGAWSICSTTKVEETKAVLRMLPLFVSSILGYLSSPLLLTFTVQQGAMMDTRVGMIHIPPAMLFIIPTTFQMAMLVVYDCFLVPFLRRRTGYTGGVTHLQRVGVGFLAMILASVVAAVVERKRQEAAARQSLFWLTPQFFMVGVADVTSFAGLLEFFNSEAPQGMKSIGAALFWCVLGLASCMATVLVQAVNRATRRSGQGGWLEGASLDDSRLDLFYWVVTVVGLLGFLNYLYWANKYVYCQDPRVAPEASVNANSP